MLHILNSVQITWTFACFCSSVTELYQSHYCIFVEIFWVHHLHLYKKRFTSFKGSSLHLHMLHARIWKDYELNREESSQRFVWHRQVCVCRLMFALAECKTSSNVYAGRQYIIDGSSMSLHGKEVSKWIEVQLSQGTSIEFWQAVLSTLKTKYDCWQKSFHNCVFSHRYLNTHAAHDEIHSKFNK